MQFADLARVILLHSFNHAGLLDSLLAQEVHFLTQVTEASGRRLVGYIVP